MKKLWIVGALVAATGLQSSVVANAAADRQSIGAALGAAGGAGLGSTIGGGNGRIAATIIGGIGGALIGSKLGRNLDDADRRAYEDAERACLTQSDSTSNRWTGGSRTGARGAFTSGRQSRNSQTGENCREYSSTIYVNGDVENDTGIACMRANGTYYKMTSDMVRYDGSSNYDDGRADDRRNRDNRDNRSHRNDHRNDSRDANSRNDSEDYRDDLQSQSPLNQFPNQNQTINYIPNQGPQGNSISNQQYDGFDRGMGYIMQLPTAPQSNVPYPYGQQQVQTTQASVRFSPIIRAEGGAWYRITFNTPVTLTGLNVRVQGTGVKIHDTAVVTESGARVPFIPLCNTAVLTPYTPMGSPMNIPERVFAVDFRAEGMNGTSDLIVTVLMAPSQGFPNLQWSVF